MDLADAGGGDRQVVPSPEHPLGWCAELVGDDGRGERRRHRRGVGLQRGERSLRLVGQALGDEADELADFHQHTLHLAELLGDVLGSADGELLVELRPPLGRRDELTGLGPGEAGGVARREAPHAPRPPRHRLAELDPGGGSQRAETDPAGSDDRSSVRFHAGSGGGERRAAGRSASTSTGSDAPDTSSVQYVPASRRPSAVSTSARSAAMASRSGSTGGQASAPTVSGSGRGNHVHSGRGDAADQWWPLARPPDRRAHAGAVDDRPRHLRRVSLGAVDLARSGPLRRAGPQLHVERVGPVRRCRPQRGVPGRPVGDDQVRPADGADRARARCRLGRTRRQVPARARCVPVHLHLDRRNVRRRRQLDVVVPLATRCRRAGERRVVRRPLSRHQGARPAA